ncbi:MAG TPA: hypothetical protein VGB77_15595 [Abditibacteriaceae bacterium]
MVKNFRQQLSRAVAFGLAFSVLADQTSRADDASNNTLPVTQTTAGTRDAGLEEKIASRLEEQSRFSLSLRQEPLSDMMALIETATAVRFRCGTLPDALISVHAQDAPLLATIEPLFQDMGFAMRRDGMNLFIFSNRTPGALENNPTQPVSWDLWKGAGAPPAGWANARTTLPPKLTGRVTAESLIKGSPLALGWNAPQADNLKNANWQNAGIQLDTAHHPGIAIAAPQKELKEAPVWMRWPLALREVPPGAQLLLETPADVTLFVNGAPLLANRHGTMLVDLGRVLQRGANCLALHWPRVPQDLKGAPLLRYEWFVAGKMNVPATASLAPPLFGTPKVSQPLLNRPDNGKRPGDAGATIAEVKRP